MSLTTPLLGVSKDESNLENYWEGLNQIRYGKCYYVHVHVHHAVITGLHQAEDSGEEAKSAGR